MSPTARSLALLRDRGYHAEVTEKWIPRARVRKDLWGWCDILGMQEGKPLLAVQTTTKSHMNDRIKKIKASPLFTLARKLGIEVCCHGWWKNGNRWQCEVKDVS